VAVEVACEGGRADAGMAGLGLFGQKSVIAETMPIVTAFKFCIGHRKNGLLNRYHNREKFIFGVFD
jgi:hypothetical protein